MEREKDKEKEGVCLNSRIRKREIKADGNKGRKNSKETKIARKKKKKKIERKKERK